MPLYGSGGTGATTAFPTSLDTLPQSAAVAALETRVGVTASADATSLTKRIAVLEAAGGGTRYFWGGAVNLGGSGGNQAWKGNEFTPTNTITVYGITASVNNLLADGATVQGAITTTSAGAVATITKTLVFTQAVNSGVQGGQIYLAFTSPVTMTGGVVYQIMVGSNAGGGVTSSTSFPVNSVNANMFAADYGAPPGTLAVSTYRNMVTLAPAVATTISTTAHSTGLTCAVGLVWS